MKKKPDIVKNAESILKDQIKQSLKEMTLANSPEVLAGQKAIFIATKLARSFTYSEEISNDFKELENLATKAFEGKPNLLTNLCKDIEKNYQDLNKLAALVRQELPQVN